MGSGQFASQAFTHAAYFRELQYWDSNLTPTWPTTGYASPEVTACYTHSNMLVGTGDWERYFYYGGPGGDAPRCD